MVSFARRTASSSSSKGITATTGPKISSRAALSSFETGARTVGGNQKPGPSGAEPRIATGTSSVTKEATFSRGAAEIEGDPLDRLRRAGHDLAPHLGRAGEGDLRHVGVLGEALADLASRTHDDVDHALGDAGVARYSLELHGGQRGDLCGLEHERVACGEGRGHLRGRYLQREVPGDDQADHAKRLAEGHVDAA